MKNHSLIFPGSALSEMVIVTEGVLQENLGSRLFLASLLAVWGREDLYLP